MGQFRVGQKALQEMSPGQTFADGGQCPAGTKIGRTKRVARSLDNLG